MVKLWVKILSGDISDSDLDINAKRQSLNSISCSRI